jgi:hypothetical protein
VRRYGKNTEVVSNALATGCASGVCGGEFDEVGDGASCSISISSGSIPAGAAPRIDAEDVVGAVALATGNGNSEGTTRTWTSSKCSTSACKSLSVVPQQVKSLQNSFSRVVECRYSPSVLPLARDWEPLRALIRRDDSDSTEPVIDDDNLKSILEIRI